MLCPEPYHIQKENSSPKEDEHSWKNISKKMPVEGTASLELKSYKSPKTWKKSISNFFRTQLRSTKSDDGDQPSGSQEQFDGKEISREQKWQSLGKIFRRQSFEHWSKTPGQQQGECSSSNKRLAVKKALSSYFGKKTCVANDK